MIRLINRRLIIPRGDTGSFTIPSLMKVAPETNIIAVFSIFNEIERIWTKEYEVQNDTITVEFQHEDTKDLPLGKYNWDIKIYINPQYNDSGLLIDGDEVHSYYAGFKLPDCEITLAPFHEKKGVIK